MFTSTFPVTRSSRHFALRSTIAAALIALSAGTTATAQTTTLGTRGSTASDSTAITSNAGSTWKEYKRAAEYADAVSLPLQFITMADGKKLAVRVTVPADAKGKPVAGTFPAILTQTAYRIDLGQLLGYVVQTGNSLLVGGQDKFMVQRGYVSVAVDVVGTGMSSGEGALLGTEEQEGYAAAVDWVTQQPWFNGNLGLAGTSYLGITSLQTAKQQHPAVKAVFAQVPMGDAYRGTVGIGGLLNAKFISLWLPLTHTLSVQNDIAKLNFPSWSAQIEQANQEHIASIDSWYLPTVDRAMTGVSGYATDDGDFWAVRSPIEGASRIKVPTFIVGSSNDIFQRDEPLLYEQLKKNVNAKLLIVKGSHVEAVLAAASGANTLLGNGAPGSASLMLQWFDQYVRGINTGAATLPNVTQFVEGYGVLGSTRYSKATDWPPPADPPPPPVPARQPDPHCRQARQRRDGPLRQGAQARRGELRQERFGQDRERQRGDQRRQRLLQQHGAVVAGHLGPAAQGLLYQQQHGREVAGRRHLRNALPDQRHVHQRPHPGRPVGGDHQDRSRHLGARRCGRHPGQGHAAVHRSAGRQPPGHRHHPFALRQGRDDPAVAPLHRSRPPASDPWPGHAGVRRGVPGRCPDPQGPEAAHRHQRQQPGHGRVAQAPGGPGRRRRDHHLQRCRPPLQRGAAGGAHQRAELSDAVVNGQKKAALRSGFFVS